MANNLIQFTKENSDQLELAWNGLTDETKAVYIPKGISFKSGCANVGFTHFIASQYAAHTSKELDIYK